MPTILPLSPVPENELRRIVGLPAARQIKTSFPKRALATASEARAALRRWQDAQPVPTAPKNPDIAISAVKPTAAQLSKLRAIIESDVAPAEVLRQRMNAESFFGTLYSALTSYEFMKLEAEYKRRKVSPRLASTADSEWNDVVRAAQLAFAAGGLKGLGAAQLSQYSKELTANRRNLDAIVKVANSGVSVGTPLSLDGRTTALASLTPTVERVIDTSLIATHIPDLCDEPIAEGSFTKHFSRSFSLTVRLKVWCPTWRNPFRTCWKNFTIAGVSFSVGLNVGYKVNCCGATAWGQAYAQACATIVGIEVCAGCSATVTGVAGVSRTPVATGCSYGLGFTATLECKLFGLTVFYASVPFGYTVTGPCPPAGLCD